MNAPPSQSAPDFGDRLVKFEAEWSSGQIPDVARYLRAAGEGERQYIEDLIEIDLECRWKQFQPESDLAARDAYGFPLFPRIDDYAAILPEPLQQSVFSPHCVAEEYRVRSRWGDHPDKDTFLERFPSDRTKIEAALRQIDTEFKNEGLNVSGQSSLSNAAADQATLILGQSPRKDSKLVPEGRLIGTLIGKYRLESRLGYGGFGEVWKAHDPDLKRNVAIKFPRKDRHFPPELLETFRAEAQKLAELGRIQGVVNVFECNEHDGQPYFVSDFIEGESLDKRLKREKLSHDESVRLMAKIAKTLQLAHQKDLVHRDIKPANILLDADGEPYVADFGLAISEAEQSTEPESIVGTYAYMAPEQAKGESHRVDGRADVYALGVILYRMLTGKLPYTAHTRDEYIDKILNHKIKPPRQRDDSIPKELERICLTCLQKDEDARYSSAGELARELRQFRHNTSDGRKRKLAAAIIVALCTILLAFGLLKHSLLNTQPDWTNPREIVWQPYNEQLDSYRFEPDHARFIFEANGYSLFGVNTTDHDALTIKSRFNIHGRTHVGQAGIFWAWAPVVGDNRITSRCWAILVGRPEIGDEFLLEIQQHDIGPSSGTPVSLNQRPVGRPFLIDEPDIHSFEIELTVTTKEITSIRVNNKQLLPSPLPLKAGLGPEWKVLKDTEYGMIGYHGTFSFEEFSVKPHNNFH